MGHGIGSAQDSCNGTCYFTSVHIPTIKPERFPSVGFQVIKCNGIMTPKNFQECYPEKCNAKRLRKQEDNY